MAVEFETPMKKNDMNQQAARKARNMLSLLIDLR
jgi:hypothetical protein